MSRVNFKIPELVHDDLGGSSFSVADSDRALNLKTCVGFAEEGHVFGGGVGKRRCLSTLGEGVEIEENENTRTQHISDG